MNWILKHTLPGLILVLGFTANDTVSAVAPGAKPAAQTAKAAKPTEDEMVLKIAEFARTRITMAKLPDGSFVPPETAAEKAKPILPLPVLKQVVNTGIYSEMRNACGLDWKTGFLGMMDKERSKKTWSQKQLAYMGLLHGVSMGMSSEALKQRGGCTPQMKAALAKSQ